MRERWAHTTFAGLDSVRVRFVLAAILMVVVPILRAPGLFQSPGLWAEDGGVFLTEAWNYPPLSNLVRPYHGYLHTLPRLVAALAALCPLQYDPAIYLAASWFIYALPIAYFLFSPALTRLELRIGFCLVYAFAPIAETYLNLTNLMWYTVPTILFWLAFPAPEFRRLRIAEDLFLAAAAVTGPFSILMFPLSLALPARRRTVERPIILLAGAVVQAWFLAHSDRTHTGVAPLSAAVAILTFLHTHWTFALTRSGAAELVFGLICVAALIRSGQYFPIAMICFTGLLLFSMYMSNSLEGAPRYMFMPILTVGFTLVSMIVDQRIPLVVRVMLGAVLVVFMWHADQQVLPRQAPPWRSQVEKYDQAPAGTVVRMQVAPPEWSANLVKR